MKSFITTLLICTGLLIAGWLSLQDNAAPTPAAYRSVLIDGVPHVRQKPDFCGEACAEMYLKRLGRRSDQDDVFNQSGLDPALARGCYTKELAAALSNLGFRTGPVWYRVAAENSAEQLDGAFKSLHTDLAAGVPSIVCMHYDEKPSTTEHFRLILGYDSQSDEVIYHEPAVEQGAYLRMKRERLLELWPLKYDAKSWTLIRLRLEPGQLADVPQSAGFSNADYAQHILKLKKKRPNDEFHIVLQRPFVVIGDESAEVVRQRATQTVKWAVDRIKRDYFSKDPEQIIDIWLFKDKESYDTNTEQLFGSRPHTPFGYYSSQHRALVMNISTGGGTLVHEIVHPFMAANFPACPSWFNEGLASLYEQCRDVNGHIWGSTNWRLRGLQGALGDGPVPSFKTLCGTTTREFYHEDPGTNYAQARYLCYYLQEHGLLVKYFHEFRRSANDDPTGYETLARVLGEEDMDVFHEKWQQYVMKLRFP
jgi:hypothetical protein